VTYRKIIEEQHIHDATHDNLTGLPNRTLFLDILDKALARKKRDNEFNFAVIFFDLDNFKNINDTYGHSVGNKYLKALAVLFDQFSRKVDTIARFGGDEFAILIESFQDNVGVYSFCDRMMSILKSTIPIENINITSTASMGIVHGDLRYTDPEEIIRDADFAMYKAKEKGGNNFEVFDEKLTNQ
ncbi:MAG: GGDEF domain-containing protein, partial [Anaerolineales bacterium]